MNICNCKDSFFERPARSAELDFEARFGRGVSGLSGLHHRHKVSWESPDGCYEAGLGVAYRTRQAAHATAADRRSIETINDADDELDGADGVVLGKVERGHRADGVEEHNV